ncbi:FkbM family methyltransferase [Hydrogenophaga sp. RWCD_12]|uniref:FkbM family methyltransferase n=1 Tax=Hydrogenophaga sp. RWCD_12 TaxID=3391190 RepID=UPI00398471E2
MPTPQQHESLISRIGNIIVRFWEKYYQHPKRRQEIAALTSPFVHTTDGGLRFKIDPAQYIDKIIFVEGLYEKRFLSFMKKVLPGNSVILDIGANTGNHAIYLSGGASQIHCFEPNPETFERLVENIGLNGIQNIQCHQLGLGNQNSIASFQVNLDGNLGNSGYVSDTAAQPKNTKIIQLPIKRGDELMEQLDLKAIHFIKIDVEGLEPVTLDGLRQTIAKHRPIVAFEFHGQHAKKDDFPSISSTLPGYVFAEICFAPENDGLMGKLKWWLRHGEAPELHQIEVPEPRTYENIIAIPTTNFLTLNGLDLKPPRKPLTA